MSIQGTILGYDPGGNSSQGVSKASVDSNGIHQIKTITLETAEDVIDFASGIPDLISIGVDTLSCWSTGSSGWRPADRWLRKKYTDVSNSIASPNSLYGSMGLNGMSVLMALKSQYPEVSITETHPKVLYRALMGNKYDYAHSHNKMDAFLSKIIGRKVSTENDHEWDAAISVYAAFQGLTGKWSMNLHSLPLSSSERLIKPCGDTAYWWPEKIIELNRGELFENRHLEQMEKKNQNKVHSTVQISKKKLSEKHYDCPIANCSKVFINSRGGWDAHVGSLKLHHDWHPEEKDKTKRMKLFQIEFSEWFK